ncbi:MAG TPA: helix-turn-helix domain-containing protein [Sporosarcina sp.]|nr:helix-turn-helix domain-containing protein [Sporosarcina sp.]
MQMVFLLFLFIIQVIGFYFLALLYMKVSKFNNLEKKQEKLMEEMDDAIGAYLSELKEENERLISIIEKRQKNDTLRDHVPETHQNTEPEQQAGTKAFSIKPPSYPVKAAMKSYQTAPVLKKGGLIEPETDEPELDDRTLAIRMHDDGKPIEEIAKRLGKGKTEVELLLKFR